MSAEPSNVVPLRDCPNCVAEHGRAEEFARAVAAQAEEIERLRGEVRAREEDNVLLERELRGKRSLISRLRGERNQRKETSLYWDQMEQVWQRWRELIRPEAREFSADRFEPVEERFKGGHELPEFFEAIEGARAVLAGEIGWGPRNPTTYCDLKTIFASESSMDRFRDHAKEGRRKRAVAFRELKRAFCQYGRSGWDEEVGATGFCANCALAAPTLDEGPRGAVATLTPDGQLLCERGCSHQDQLNALRAWWRDYKRAQRGEAAA